MPIETNAALRVIQAVAECIRELKQVPSGHLYARLMGTLSLAQYQEVIDLLKRTGLVVEDGSHMLTWKDIEKGSNGKT